MTRVSDTNYIALYYNSKANASTKLTFNFSSDTQGTVDFGHGKDGIFTITKH